MPSIPELERLFKVRIASPNANENRPAAVGANTQRPSETADTKVYKLPVQNNNRYAAAAAEGKTPDSQQQGSKLGIVNETDIESVSHLDPDFAFGRAGKLIAQASVLEPMTEDRPGRLEPIVDAVRLISRAEPEDPKEEVLYNKRKQEALDRIIGILKPPAQEQATSAGAAISKSGELYNIQDAKRGRA